MSLFDIHISLSCRALCALSITVMLNEVDGGDADTDDDDDDDDDQDDQDGTGDAGLPSVTGISKDALFKTSDKLGGTKVVRETVWMNYFILFFGQE